MSTSRWIRQLTLAALLALPALAASQVPAPMGEREQPVEPEVERREVTIPRIKSRDIELGAYVGTLQMDSFGSNAVYGVRAGFHLSEDFFLEASYGWSELSDGAFRRFGLPLFENEETDLDYYQFSAAYNALPGELFLGSSRAYRSALFLVLGAGNLSFAEEDYFTVNLGFGIRVLPTDWLTLRLDVREYLFETDILGKHELTYNPEITAGIGVYF